MNAVVLAFLALAGGPQDEKDHKVLILKQERSTYVPAVEKFREAEKLMKSDPLECARLCGKLLENESIKADHWDSMIRIQNTDGSYGDWALFAPYQLRGRVLLERAQALGSTDRREAAKQARLAVIDLDESVRRGLKSSGEFLDRAKKLSEQLKGADETSNERNAEAERRLAEIRKLVEQKATPESVLDKCAAAEGAVKDTPYSVEWRILRKEALKARYGAHADDGKYRSARIAIATLGGFLTEVERKEALAEIERKSHDRALQFHSGLCRLLDNKTWAAFVATSDAEIERLLALPPADEMDAADAELTWARHCRQELIRIRTSPVGTLDEYLAVLTRTSTLWVEAAGQVREPAFSALEALLQDLAVVRLERNIAGASTEESEGLARRRDEVQRIIKVVEPFALQVKKDHPFITKLRSYPERLPVDLPRIDEIGRELFDPANSKGLWGRSLDLTRDYETELGELERAKGSRLSRGARRKLGTCLLVSEIARRLLSGARTEDLVQSDELKTRARKLAADGGPLPDMMNAVSPRIREVVDRLKP